MKKTFVLCILLATLFLMIQGCSKKDDTLKVENQMTKLQGTWSGTIQVLTQSLPIDVTFNEENASISIPAQGISNYPLTAIQFDDPQVYFEMMIQNQKLTFDGVLDQETISGTFTQQGQSFLFELTKSGSVEREREIGTKIEIPVAGGNMTALVVTPEGEGPFPAMLILSGSGPTDRNGNSPMMAGNTNSLLMIAEALAAQGIASIRYDKRGVGENTALVSKEEDLRFDDYVHDAAAWIDYANTKDTFTSIGVIGHSEGSLIGMIAAEQQQASSFVSLAGAGRAIDRVLIEQLTAQLPENLLAESEDIIEQLKSGKAVDRVSPELTSIFRPSVQPYLMSWLAYDPQEELAKLNVPILIIGGTTDLQVPVEDAKLLGNANEQAELVVIENMNHVLKSTSADRQENMASYSNPDLPLADGLIEKIFIFLK